MKEASANFFFCKMDHSKFAHDATQEIREIITQRLFDLRRRLKRLAQLQATRQSLSPFVPARIT
jgi:hypothetical protein